uniref:Ribosomal protein S4 n=1 Tax=Tsukubamonas globosa TaxID=875863 RepID=W8VJW1_9EUKA|nr:ribosomal protein S4 [Tsukubamonas globosa]BAO51980.1 ribosomal protein S4 [Tsukubamonas globosa]
MTKIKSSKYKVLRQHYIDLWNSDKRGVKVLRRILLLRIFMHVLESKRWLLKQINSGRSMYRLNLYISQRLERMLQFIPDTYIDLNTKTRIFKYIKRKSVRRFGSLDRTFLDLIRILEKQKDGGTSRYTSFRVFFRRKQLLQSYYGNVTLRWLRKVVRTYKLTIPESPKPTLPSLLESRLDNVIHNLGATASIFQAQQLINHGVVRVNNCLQRTTNVLVEPGDIISSISFGRTASSKIDILSNLFDLHYLFKVESQSSSKKGSVQYHKSLNPFVTKSDTDSRSICYFSVFSYTASSTTDLPLVSHGSLFPAWDILEQTARYKKLKTSTFLLEIFTLFT